MTLFAALAGSLNRQHASQAAGFATVAIAAAVLLGWWAGLPLLSSWGSGFPPMRPVGALCLGASRPAASAAFHRSMTWSRAALSGLRLSRDFGGALGLTGKVLFGHRTGLRPQGETSTLWSRLGSFQLVGRFHE